MTRSSSGRFLAVARTLAVAAMVLAPSAADARLVRLVKDRFLDPEDALQYVAAAQASDVLR